MCADLAVIAGVLTSPTSCCSARLGNSRAPSDHSHCERRRGRGPDPFLSAQGSLFGRSSGQGRAAGGPPFGGCGDAVPIPSSVSGQPARSRSCCSLRLSSWPGLLWAMREVGARHLPMSLSTVLTPFTAIAWPPSARVVVSTGWTVVPSLTLNFTAGLWGHRHDLTLIVLMLFGFGYLLPMNSIRAALATVPRNPHSPHCLGRRIADTVARACSRRRSSACRSFEILAGRMPAPSRHWDRRGSWDSLPGCGARRGSSSRATAQRGLIGTCARRCGSR